MGDLGHTTTAVHNLMVLEMHENWKKTCYTSKTGVKTAKTR